MPSGDEEEIAAEVFRIVTPATMRALLERTTSYPSLIHQAQDSPGGGSYANLVAGAPLRSGHSPNQAWGGGGSSHDTSRGSFQAGRGSRISSGLCDIHLRESDYLSHAPQASVSRPLIRAASHTSSLWRMGRRSACRLRKSVFIYPTRSARGNGLTGGKRRQRLFA